MTIATMRTGAVGLCGALSGVAACSAPAADPCGGAPCPVDVVMTAETSAELAHTRAEFLSFSIDASNIGQDYDFGRPALRAMAGALAPAYLRIGGTRSDNVYYDLSDTPVATPPPGYDLVLGRTWWDAACGFAADLGLEILFTLDAGAGPRDLAGDWTSDNARTLLEYSVAHACPVAVWELGNEVNGFPLAQGFELTGAEYAADMAVARALVDEVDPASLLAGPTSIYWPLWGELIPVMPEFMATGGSLVDVVTWHYYPQQSSKCALASRRAEMETLLRGDHLDEVRVWAGEVEGLRDAHAPTAEVWLDETGHALCGGEPGQSDRFVSGFWWLDELGLLAARGEQVVVRQALTGGEYNLVDNATLEPAPDYFNSLLWKRLMGTKSLAVAFDDRGGLLRAYAHCTAGMPGAVTALALNLSADTPVALDFAGLGTRREIFRLSAETLDSSVLYLNGAPLAVDASGVPLPLPPELATGPVELAPRTYAFVTLPDAAAAACL